MLVFPAPRRAPVAVIWRPSKSWNTATMKSSGTAAAITAGDGEKPRAMVPGMAMKTHEAVSMKMLESSIPVQPAAFAPEASRRPMACPTRTLVAVLMPMGTIKVKLAQSSAI